jgi:hypothetical protein
MSGLFEHISAFDNQAQTATRQAVAVAHKRFNDRFSPFLKNASTDFEFNSRLALVDADVKAMIADVAAEYDADAIKVEAALKSAIAATRISGCGCGDKCDDDCSCDADSCSCSKKRSKKDPDKGSKRPEHLKAQDEIQEADEHSQVPPWLKKQDDDEDQEDGGNRKSKVATEENEKSNIKTKSCQECGKEFEPIHNDEEDVYCPGCSLGNSPAWKSVFGSAAHKVEQKDGKYFVIEDGDEKAAGPFDSKEEAEARAEKLNGLENLEKEAAGPMGPGGFTPAPGLETLPGFTPGLGLGGTMNSGGLGELPKVDTNIPQPWNGQPLFNPNGTDNPKALPDYWNDPANERELIDRNNQILGEQNALDAITIKPSNPSQALVASVTPAMAKALELKEAAKPETGDSTEEREELPTGDESALDGPSPKMDKKKWKPNATNPEGNLKPIESEGDHSPHPTHKQDIKQKPDYENEDIAEHDNKVWKREQLKSDTEDNAGFNKDKNVKDQPTKAAETWHGMDGLTDPVTKVSLPEALSENTKK